MARFEACLVGVVLMLACTDPEVESRPTNVEIPSLPLEVAPLPPKDPCICDADDRRRGRPSRLASLYIHEARACAKASGGPSSPSVGCNPDDWLLEEVAACIVCKQTGGPRLTDGWYLKFRDGRMRWGAVEHRPDRDLMIRHEVDANDGSYSTAVLPTRARLVYEPGVSTSPCGAGLPGFTEHGYQEATRELEERYAEMMAAAQRNEADPIEFCDYSLLNAALMFRWALGMAEDPRWAKLPDAAVRTASTAHALIEMTISGCEVTATDWYGRAEAAYLGFAAATHIGDQAGATRWRKLLQREFPGHAFTALALDCWGLTEVER